MCRDYLKRVHNESPSVFEWKWEESKLEWYIECVRFESVRCVTWEGDVLKRLGADWKKLCCPVLCIYLQDFKLDWDIVQTTNIIHIGHTSELQWYFMDQIMVMKVIVVRDTRDLKSLGPKRPCGFDSRPGHKRQMHGICNLPSWCQVLFISSVGWERNLRDYPWQM